MAVLVQPVVLIPVALVFFSIGYLTRDYIAALLPTFLAVLCAFALWRQTRGGGIAQGPTVTALMLCGLGVVSCLLGAAFARERLGERSRPEWLRRTLIVVRGLGDGDLREPDDAPSTAALQWVGSKVRMTLGCLALAAITDALWINQALHDDAPPVATALLLYAGLPALLVSTRARGGAWSRVGCAGLYLACMALIATIWFFFWLASCGDLCR